MATLQFKAESPYIRRDERKHDPTDFKYQAFLDNTAGVFSSRKTVSIALFGVGRAGKYSVL